MKSIGSIIKENLVLFLAVAAALASMTAVPPSAAYAGYINMPVLAILFCLMVVIGGVRESGVFSAVLARLLLRLGTMRQLAAVLVFACFFVSMWVTNDVALLTFVPFSLMALPKVASEEQMALVIVLQTLAANLGSMLTPIGNPQNLFIYAHYHLPLAEFLSITAPITVLSAVLLQWCTGARTRVDSWLPRLKMVWPDVPHHVITLFRNEIAALMNELADVGINPEDYCDSDIESGFASDPDLEDEEAPDRG